MTGTASKLAQAFIALLFSAGAVSAADPLPQGSIEAGASSPFTFFIQKVSAVPDAHPNGNFADIAFATREPSHALVEVSAKRFADFPDTTPAGQQPAPAFPAGAVTMSRNDSLGAKLTQHAFRMDGLAPNKTFYFVITTSGADGRTFRYWDSFKTPDNRRVKIVFEKINFTRKTLGLSYSYPNGKLTYAHAEALQLIAGVNGQWGAPDVGYWRYPRDGSFANIGGSTVSNVYQPAGWETVNIEAIVENAPDRLALKLLAFDAASTKEHLKGGYYVAATYPNDPRPTLFEGPQTDAGHENSDAYWSTAVGEIDTTSGGTFQAGSGSFRLIQTEEAINLTNSDNYNPEFYLKYPRGLLFEVMGRFEVSYVKPRPIEISAPRDPLEKKSQRGALAGLFGKTPAPRAPRTEAPIDLAALHARGAAIANEDSAAAELRGQHADGPARRGFDIGLAAAEGQTLPGPGKQRIHDMLSPLEQAGYAAAVAFSLERNRLKIYDAAPRGLTIANADPLAIELRAQQRDAAARLGFDIGMAAAEGQTAQGPGKQGIYDSLSAAEQPGFKAAVDFSVERNSNVEMAAAGAAIANRDPVVAVARSASADVFFRLGFDIASGYFGDPALGGLGYTATGPGSLGVRTALSAAGQQGFDAAVAFHFSRTYAH